MFQAQGRRPVPAVLGVGILRRLVWGQDRSMHFLQTVGEREATWTLQESSP